MKKIRLILILIIMLSITVLGLFLGKQVFSSLENRGYAASKPTTPQPTNMVAAPETSVQTDGNPQNAPAPLNSQNVKVSVPANFSAPANSNLPKSFSESNPNVSSPITQMAAGTNASSAATIGKPDDKPWSPASGTKWVAYIATKGVNVRDGPNLESKQIFRLLQGTRGTVQERRSGWTKVKWDFNKKIGWVRDDLLTQGPLEVMLGLMTPNGKIASAPTSEAIQAAAKKAAQMADSISVAVAKPALPSETVKGFTSGKLPKEAVIVADPFAKVRVSPNPKAEKVGKIAKGMTVSIKNFQQVGPYQWFEIIYSNGKKSGWTREDNLKF
ncbi:MAG: SH3 domain-containing protein [Candidatus Riflebacteria bacterium]|nr:SH3 domain-containing protein [Candidatus Riflebacteria bacterium]